MASTTKVRATLIEMFTRLIPTVKQDNTLVYFNGDDNLYPYDIEAVINNSPTAKRSASLMAKYIAGSGVSQGGVLLDYAALPFVNKQKGYKITDIIRLASRSLSKQNGVWLHVGYGLDDKANIVQNKLDVFDYCKPRKAKEDDEKNEAKIFVNDWTEKTRMGGKKKDMKWFYPYNPDPKVVLSQIKADAKEKGEFNLESAIKNYRGQVYYLNLTPEYQYALSDFDSVYNDCDTEYRIGLYSNTQSRTGFQGKVLVLTQGLDDEQSKKVDAELGQWLGSENSGSLYHMDVAESDDIKNYVHIEQLKAQMDDKLYVETDKRLKRNIMGSAENIPEQLVYSSDGLFGTQADTYTEMKLFYSEQTKEKRDALQNALSYVGFPYEIEPVVSNQQAEESDPETEKRIAAQAELKGSVGGVTALIELQRSVSEGFTDRASAIQIIETIYGIDRATAELMIGTPVDTTEQTLESDVQQPTE